VRLTQLHDIIFPETCHKITLHITCIHNILGGNQLAPLEPVTDRKITQDTEINLTYHNTQKHMECRGVCSGFQLIFNKEQNAMNILKYRNEPDQKVYLFKTIQTSYKFLHRVKTA